MMFNVFCVCASWIMCGQTVEEWKRRQHRFRQYSLPIYCILMTGWLMIKWANTYIPFCFHSFTNVDHPVDCSDSNERTPAYMALIFRCFFFSIILLFFPYLIFHAWKPCIRKEENGGKEKIIIKKKNKKKNEPIVYNNCRTSYRNDLRFIFIFFSFIL